MVSSSTMHNFPSPWRVNHAGEVVRDANDAEQVLRKVPSPESKSMFGSSDTDGQKSKGKKESWLRIVRKKKDKQDDNALNFQGLDNILENMECFSCGALGDDAEDGKKKNRFLSKKGTKTDEDKSKKEKIKKKEQAPASKEKSSAKSDQKTKWFQKKKQQDDEEPAQYDIWAAVMPTSFTGLTTNDEKDKKKDNGAASKDNGIAKPEQKTKWFQKKNQPDENKLEQKESEQYDIWAAIMPASSPAPESTEDAAKKKKSEKKAKLQWFRLSRKGKQQKDQTKDSRLEEEESKGFDFNELSAMISALVNYEAEQAETGANKDENKQDDTDVKEREAKKEVGPDAESSLSLWFEQLKADGEGYIRFVSGSDPSENDQPSYNLDNGVSAKGAGEGEEVSMDGTVLSDGSETWVTEYSSYEVPSLRQEWKMLMTGRFGSKPKRFKTSSKAPHPQEDEKFLLRKIANDPASRRTAEQNKDNTLTLHTLNKLGTTRDHGFKVKLHEDRTICEV